MTAAKKAATTAAEGVKQVEEAIAASKQNAEKVVKATREQIEKASDAALKGYDDVTVFNQESLDAMTESANILAKGAEDLGKAYVAFAQASVKANMEAGKALIAAKTPGELVELQADLAKSNLDAAIAESTRMSEMMMKLAGESAEPLRRNFNKNLEQTFEKFSS